MTKVILVFTALILGLQAGAQTLSAKDIADREREWGVRNKFFYRNRVMLANLLTAMKDKVPTALPQKISFAKAINAGQIHPDFKASISTSGPDIQGTIKTSELADFQKINQVVNTARPATLTGGFFGENEPVQVDDKITESVTAELLFRAQKRGGRNVDSLSEAFWAEPVQNGVRVCAMKGESAKGLNDGRNLCFEMSSDNKITTRTGNGNPIRLELYNTNPSENLNIAIGSDLLRVRASYIDPELQKPSRPRLQALIDTLIAASKLRALVAEEARELAELKALYAKNFPGAIQYK